MDIFGVILLPDPRQLWIQRFLQYSSCQTPEYNHYPPSLQCFYLRSTVFDARIHWWSFYLLTGCTGYGTRPDVIVVAVVTNRVIWRCFALCFKRLGWYTGELYMPVQSSFLPCFVHRAVHYGFNMWYSSPLALEFLPSLLALSCQTPVFLPRRITCPYKTQILQPANRGTASRHSPSYGPARPIQSRAAVFLPALTAIASSSLAHSFCF